ncbi:MAG: hypothetical protein QF412_07050 [Planctomycetota bacterium]|nr:hypothetical protein [Planctomycetota bacterium]
MLTRSRLFALAIAPVGLASLLPVIPLPKSTGILPGELFIPPNVTSAFPSCGQCHNSRPNANGRVTVALTPFARVLDAGAKVPVNVRVLGGPTGGLAGFSMATDRGSFQAGSNTRTTSNGDAITHADKFGNNWNFSYKAPTSPGLVQWTAVGQSVNANNNPAGDSWGFHGPDSSKPGVPLQMYVNAPSVTALRGGCAGSDGHVPLLGARVSATIASRFVTECYAAPVGVSVFCALGDSSRSFGNLPLPFDLAAIGAKGCFVQANHLVVQRATTSGSGSGGGSAQFAWPVPNKPKLRGLDIYFQGFVFDPKANRLGVTVTNGLRVRIR